MDPLDLIYSPIVVPGYKFVVNQILLIVVILEKQLSAVTPELIPGSSPNFIHRYI
jgi:hypothetical protein